MILEFLNITGIDYQEEVYFIFDFLGIHIKELLKIIISIVNKIVIQNVYNFTKYISNNNIVSNYRSILALEFEFKVENI